MVADDERAKPTPRLKGKVESAASFNEKKKWWEPDSCVLGVASFGTQPRHRKNALGTNVPLVFDSLGQKGHWDLG